MIEEIEHAGWGAPCAPQPTTVVKIRLDGMGKPCYPVTAFVFGVWAVHRGTCKSSEPRLVPPPDSWSVSHLPTGMSALPDHFDDFWSCIRVARALEDSGVFRTKKSVLSPDLEETCLFFSIVGAALSDHYVWPLGTTS